MGSDAARFERELADDPALVERILREFLLPPERERVLIRCDSVSVDHALARALALGTEGIEAKIELEA